MNCEPNEPFSSKLLLLELPVVVTGKEEKHYVLQGLTFKNKWKLCLYVYLYNKTPEIKMVSPLTASEPKLQYCLVHLFGLSVGHSHSGWPLLTQRKLMPEGRVPCVEEEDACGRDHPAKEHARGPGEQGKVTG